MRDNSKDAIESFKYWYKDDWDKYEAMPDPQVHGVWLVLAKRELKKTVKVLAAIMYLKDSLAKDDCEEVSFVEALEKHSHGFYEAHYWLDNIGKKKVIDVGTM